jgi:hypothetical protein
VYAHRDFGFTLGEDVLSDFRRSLLGAFADVTTVFILVADVGNAVAEIHALVPGSAAHRSLTVR